MGALFYAQITVIVYIDGFNFYYGAVKDTPHKCSTLELFATRLRNEDEVLKIRYFTSLMKNKASKERQVVFLNALSTRPLIKCELGSFKKKDVEVQSDGLST
jgi:hypothetical protein